MTFFANKVNVTNTIITKRTIFIIMFAYINYNFAANPSIRTLHTFHSKKTQKAIKYQQLVKQIPSLLKKRLGTSSFISHERLSDLPSEPA